MKKLTIQNKTREGEFLKVMKKIAIVTDSNSGISQEEAKNLGCFVVPMPFIIKEDTFFEGINLSNEEFYNIQASGTRVTTSQPNINEIVELWQNLLKDFDEVVHIPMSSGLSQSCETAQNFAENFDSKVQVVDNRRISITMRASVVDAVKMAKNGNSASEIKKYLEETALHSSIYIMVDTLKYLKQGGRITPAAAAIGTVLNIKPVLQIQGGKLDTYAKVLNVKSARGKMIEALKKDLEGRFAEFVKEGSMRISVAHTKNDENAKAFAEELQQNFPNIPLEFVDSLSLSVATHIGPKSLACACYRIY